MAQVNYSDNGLVLIKKVSGSAVSEIIVDDCFSANYSQYKIIFDFVKNSATNRAVNMRLRTGGLNNSNSEYNWQYIYAESTTVGASRSTTATEWVNVAYGAASAGQKSITLMEILNPFQNTYTTMYFLRGYLTATSASIGVDSFACGIDVTTSFNGFSVYPTAETLTGDIYVYGYKES